MILFPGTAVPTPDTYTNTFIPVFKDQDVAGADVMLITNPSISLGDAQTTAEYAVFAFNYAALVLSRKATVISWSQGSLNVQWAFKYWPSTRENVKNYVDMPPDFDGTLDASFLCDPEKLLTSNPGTLVADSLTDDALPMDLEDILGIGRLPTDPDQFKLYLLALMSGNLTSFMPSSTTSTSATGVATSSGLDLPTSLSLPDLSSKRAVPFGTPQKLEEVRTIETVINRRALDLARRQGAGGSQSALAQLLAGLAGPIAEALTSLAAQPTSVFEEVLSNLGGNLLNLHLLAVIPQGCLPSIWQQVYFSNFVNVLATDYGNGVGDSAFVPTTTVFSLTDEVVEPQGATGFESASGYLKNASNILIQGNGGCPIVEPTVLSGLPTVITHEGVLYSGMGVGAAVIAAQMGGEVTPDMIDASVRCADISPLLTPHDTLAQEATIPGALARVLFGGGDEPLGEGFLPAEPAIKAYATREF